MSNPSSLSPRRATPTISFELMPPSKTVGTEPFWHAIEGLMSAHPEFVSVTYGAGGHNREAAHEVIARLVQEVPARTLAHLTSVGAPLEQTISVVDQYLAAGVRSFLALRGDPPRAGRAHYPDELKSAVELMGLLQEREELRCVASPADSLRAAIRPLIIAVATFPAGNPAAGTTPAQEVERLLQKQEAGASFAITQLFYRADTYAEFLALARAAGVELEIVPGILPPINPRRLRRVAELSGVEPEKGLLAELEAAGPQRAREIGIAAGADLIGEVLAAGAPGVHMYTFNQAAVSLEILCRAGLLPPADPELSAPAGCKAPDLIRPQAQ